jgi:predicted RNA methylase
VKVPPEVLEVLNGQAEADGQLLRLPLLDPALYNQVTKILVAAGGRWDGSKQARGHRFEGPADRILAQLRTGTLTPAQENDFVLTPPKIASFLSGFVDVGPGNTILDPSAGTGALVRALVPAGATVHMIESDPAHAPALEALLEEGVATELVIGDFLAMSPPVPGAACGPPGTELEHAYDAVVMHPPLYAQVHHLLHAWEWLTPGGQLAAIVSAGVTFRRDRHHDELRDLITEHGRVVKGRIPADAFAAFGVREHTVIVTMTKPTA